MSKTATKELHSLRKELKRELRLSKQNLDCLRRFASESPEARSRFENYRGQTQGLGMALKRIDRLIER
jgi:hypothetical protein